MGTYISHFRNVEILLTEVKGLDAEAFLYGNLAPDAGIPNQAGTQFNPPRTITHFLSSDNEAQSADLEFYRQYLQLVDQATDPHKYSFLLGYFIHLICDNLWTLWIVDASVKDYGNLIAKRGSEAWRLLKQDWHDLDRKYYRDHSESGIWETMQLLQTPPAYLSYLPPTAMSQQMAYLENVYLQAGESRELDRTYPYLNTITMERFVDESTKLVLEILSQPEKLSASCHQTALSLLRSEKLRPYGYPLGDAQ